MRLKTLLLIITCISTYIIVTDAGAITLLAALTHFYTAAEVLFLTATTAIEGAALGLSTAAAPVIIPIAAIGVTSYSIYQYAQTPTPTIHPTKFQSYQRPTYQPTTYNPTSYQSPRYNPTTIPTTIPTTTSSKPTVPSSNPTTTSSKSSTQNDVKSNEARPSLHPKEPGGYRCGGNINGHFAKYERDPYPKPLLVGALMARTVLVEDINGYTFCENDRSVRYKYPVYRIVFDSQVNSQQYETIIELYNADLNHLQLSKQLVKHWLTDAIYAENLGFNYIKTSSKYLQSMVFSYLNKGTQPIVPNYIHSEISNIITTGQIEGMETTSSVRIIELTDKIMNKIRLQQFLLIMKSHDCLHLLDDVALEGGILLAESYLCRTP